MNNEFVVSSSPFIHSKNDVNKMFLYVALALVFPAIYGIVQFGLGALLIVGISLVSSAASEFLYNILNSRKVYINNLSFMVTGLILALTLPVGTPAYVVSLAAFISVFVVKMCFGGLGRNLFNPACTGRCFAGIIYPALSSELYKLTVFGENYTSLTAGGTNNILDLLIGKGTGGIGTTFIIMLVVCFIVLAICRVVDAKITLLAILGYFVTSICLNNLETTMINMLSGSFIFVSIFVITDPNSSPNNLIGKLIYSLGFGAISAAVWKTGLLGENTVFAVALFMNILVPFMDKYFVLRPISLGGYRYARKN